MKKIILCFVFFILCMFSFLTLNINAQDTFTIKTLDKVQTRTIDPNGIKFIGQVTGLIDGDDIRYGIIFGKGIHTNLTHQTNDNVYAEVNETTINGEFYVTMIKFPVTCYTMYVTARAYVVVDGVYKYANEHVIKSLYDVVLTYKKDVSYVSNEFIEEIINNVSNYNITYHANDGNILNEIYETRNELIRDFVSDFNKYSGKVVAADGSDFFARSWMNDGTKVGYNFLTSIEYKYKWGWLLTYINKVRGIEITVEDEQAITRGEIHNFLNSCAPSDVTSNYGSDYSSDAIANGFWNSVDTYTVSNSTSFLFPKKEGYIFDGWYTDKTCTSGKVNIINKDLEVFAKWIKLDELESNNYKIIYNLNGGMLSDVNYELTLRETFMIDTLNTSLFTNSNYLTKTSIFSNEYITSNNLTYTYYYRVGFSYDSIKNMYVVDHIIPSGTSFVDNVFSDYYIIVSTNTLVEQNIKDVYTQIQKIQFGDIINIDMTLTNNSNSALNAIVDVLYGSGESYQIYKEGTVLPIPIRGGYEFMGYFESAEFSGNEIILAEKDMTLYAKWEKIDASKILNCVSDVATSNTLDALVTSDDIANYTWSSSNPNLYQIKNGIGFVSKVYQTHKAQNVTITVDINYKDGKNETKEKVITVNPVLYSDMINSPIATYFQTSAISTYQNYNNRYKTEGTLFSESTKETLDIIYLSFAIPDSTGNVTMNSTLINYIDEIKELKNYNVRIILCIDGANEEPCQAFKTITASDTLTDTFVNNIMDLVEKYNFDGVDIDWEARTDNLKPNADGMYRLMSKLRAEMTLRQDVGGTSYLLTAAIPPSDWADTALETRFDLSRLNEFVDYINMMSYDLNDVSIATHVSPLYKSEYGYPYSITTGVEAFTRYGLDKNKIIIGSAGYGKAYKITGTVDSCINLPALGLNGTIGQISGITGSYNSGTLFGNAIKTLMNNGYIEYHEYDKDGNFVGSYLYNSNTKYFVTYDSTLAIKEKYKYAQANGIGMMYWAYTEDPYDTIIDTLSTLK